MVVTAKRWPSEVTRGPNRVNLPGNVANSNATPNTLADLTGLSFPVVSGTRYGWRARIRYTSAATTTGSRWTANGPTASVIEIGVLWALSATAPQIEAQTAWNAGAVSAGSATAANVAVIEGEVLPTANGTVIIRFSSEVASSAITAIAAGSWLDWWTIE